MEGPQPQREPPWAAEIVLSLTGVPKAERATIQELVERSGGRYSPNLSRRCTHLAVPGGVSERSEKLHSALRNRHKWGLHIVDLRWVLESAQAGQRLDEEGFPVHPLPQEQAAPAASARRPVDSWAVGGGGVSEQAADTYQQPQRPGSLPPATVAAAAARAARPANPLRNSVNSRPLSTFTAGQPAPSLQTQAPSAGRSVRWQVSEGSPMQWGACSGAAAAAAAAHAAAAAVLPGQVEQRRLVQQEAEEEMDFSKLPMTQAGFIPAADLLQQLRASTAGLLPAEAAPQPAQRQPQRPLPAEPQPQAQAQQRYGSPASWQPQPMEQPPLPSSAGSPPVLRSAAGTPEAPAQADAVSPAGSGSRKPDAASSQVAESCRVFGGMLAIVDPSLPPEEQQRVAAALEQGGGRVAAGGSLARGMTHVVCQPDQALKWLSMGVGIVSPAWVLQSLRTGKQQRCLMVSADASRHLPAASTATDGSTQQAAGSEAGSGGGSSGSSMRTAGQQLSGDLLASKEARQQALLQLAGQGAAAAGGTRASTPGAAGPAMPGGHRPAATPAELLVGVLWSVLESPHTARLEARCKARSAQEEEEVVIIPDSEDEEEEQARLCCISASQAVVADVLCEATEGADHPGDGSAGAEPAAAAAAAWQQDVVLHGPASVTLLLPRDARGELGSDTRCFIVPAGRQGARELTAAQLLGLVHSYYAEQLPPGEQLSLLQAYPAAEGAAAVLRPAFLELAALPRGDLLGPRCAFEGLRKATRDPAGAVYEVLLGS
ncbi:BRCT domain DNA repair [Chlorella sorokiniana]|uniref:BRCT domain DNA repair n=1 Tax=Chlorella sorokiniana TaxID=3076 RepID=A0A2P6U0Y7_CHLSO|nr:BRCT domain DNA repair [Chlorella sorokiniana]|eukprot:PRW59970.1 BRCT domain DNA repair [Chlorella sorokiniana]